MSRVYIRWRNGKKEVREFEDQAMAYSAWLALPKGVGAAFRGANDTRPVYGWDYVDRF